MRMRLALSTTPDEKPHMFFPLRDRRFGGRDDAESYDPSRELPSASCFELVTGEFYAAVVEITSLLWKCTFDRVALCGYACRCSLAAGRRLDGRACLQR